ncbi:MAG: FUSC family protein [Solirubrobacterales bacterium]|nr:FUSC family protein [Solirubrobacterales bacterium]
MGTSTLTAGPEPSIRPWAAALVWLRDRDPDLVALRRAVRTAIVMPAMFALVDKVIANPAMATFAAFGSIAMVLLVDFPGSIRERVTAQAALVVCGGVMICVGTLASRTPWVAAVAMGLVAFPVAFAGVISSVLAGATTSLLLSFILPVCLPGSASAIPDRLAGWGLAGVASLVAIAVLWPAPPHNPIRAAAIRVCRELAARLRAEVAYVVGPDTPEAHATLTTAIAAAQSEVGALHRVFYATPYRPTRLTVDARAVVRLVDELRWLNAIVLRASPTVHPAHANPRACEVKKAAAEVLERAAELLAAPRRDRAPLEHAARVLRDRLRELERATTESLAASADGDPAQRSPAARVSGLSPSFRAQELSFVVGEVAANTIYAAAAERRSAIDRLLGRPPVGLSGTLSAVHERAGAYLERNSTWLHNSLRAAVGLGLAVLVADLSSVQHAFWVVLGTLSVLRSNALSTGQTVIQALLGTVAGFVVGGALVVLIGTDTTVLWILLPFALLLAGLAPATVSFAAGQAAFTLVLVILFNIIAPAGWSVGLVRVGDIALGGAVSLAVGALFWPRGAGSLLGRALAQAYSDSARYLSEAVAYGVGRCDASGPAPGAPRELALQAAAAARRLDDTYRGYLAERGAKPVPLSQVTTLVTGVAGVRLAADAVLDLWDDDGHGGGDRAGVRRELQYVTARLTSWYDQFAASLAASTTVPDALAADPVVDERLVEAVERDLGDDGPAAAIGVRVIWTGDHLDAVRRLQEALVDPAREAVAERALSVDDMWWLRRRARRAEVVG